MSFGGDADIVSAIAGAVAKARFGVPGDIAARGRSYLTAELREVMGAPCAARGCRFREHGRPCDRASD
jgi:ADP-ribosylglycohydrolase